MILESFQNGKKHGFHTSWYTNENKKQEGEYLSGLKEESGFIGIITEKLKNKVMPNNLIGTWISGYDNGQKSNEGNYIEGMKEGKWLGGVRWGSTV